MRNGFMGAALTLGVLALASVLSAQTASPSGAAASKAVPRGPDGKPDFSGVYLTTPLNALVFSKEGPPLQPWALEKSIYNREDPKVLVAHGRNEMDPYVNCAWAGMPRLWLGPTPFEVVQSPQRVLILFENNQEVRHVWTDGRDHPAGFGHSFKGHSIGKWDGDTLVVDTIGLLDITWLDYAGSIHSDALHIVERIRRPDYNNLVIDMTMDDSKAFTRPYVVTRRAVLRPAWDLGEVNQCEARYREFGNAGYIH